MIKLANGIQLTKAYIVQPKGDNVIRIAKAEARAVFNGKADLVNCACAICEPSSIPHVWRIGRSDKSISIGCVRFGPSEVAQVRKWLRTK